MKILISHDVDHLYPKDHFFRDLIIPKLWVRSLIQLFQKKITVKVFLSRIGIVFDKRWNRIDELMAFDRAHNIPSVFFFGMGNILGMSYKQKEAEPIIKKVIEQGFEAGVHGANIDQYNAMKDEYEAFKRLSGESAFGVRIHYVRYHTHTFSDLERIGYLFDTSEFNKKEIELKQPYKIGTMWEIPLHIMDGYVLAEGLEKAKEKTIAAFERAEKENLPYVSLLFHDPLFNAKREPEAKEYYEWFVNQCELRKYDFASYKNLVNKLNAQ